MDYRLVRNRCGSTEAATSAFLAQSMSPCVAQPEEHQWDPYVHRMLFQGFLYWIFHVFGMIYIVFVFFVLFIEKYTFDSGVVSVQLCLYLADQTE